MIELSACLDVSRRDGNVLFELWVQPLLAETYIRMGRLADAAACLGRASELLTSGQDWRGLPALTRRADGMLAGADGRWDEAERCFENALAINRRYGLVWDEAKTLFEWGLLDRARGSPAARDRAQHRFGIALETFQGISADADVGVVQAAIGAHDRR